MRRVVRWINLILWRVLVPASAMTYLMTTPNY